MGPSTRAWERSRGCDSTEQRPPVTASSVLLVVLVVLVVVVVGHCTRSLRKVIALKRSPLRTAVPMVASTTVGSWTR